MTKTLCIYIYIFFLHSLVNRYQNRCIVDWVSKVVGSGSWPRSRLELARVPEFLLQSIFMQDYSHLILNLGRCRFAEPHYQWAKSTGLHLMMPQLHLKAVSSSGAVTLLTPASIRLTAGGINWFYRCWQVRGAQPWLAKDFSSGHCGWSIEAGFCSSICKQIYANCASSRAQTPMHVSVCLM